MDQISDESRTCLPIPLSIDVTYDITLWLLEPTESIHLVSEIQSHGCALAVGIVEVKRTWQVTIHSRRACRQYQSSRLHSLDSALLQSASLFIVYIHRRSSSREHSC